MVQGPTLAPHPQHSHDRESREDTNGKEMNVGLLLVYLNIKRKNDKRENAIE